MTNVTDSADAICKLGLVAESTKPEINMLQPTPGCCLLLDSLLEPGKVLLQGAGMDRAFICESSNEGQVHSMLHTRLDRG